MVNIHVRGLSTKSLLTNCFFGWRASLYSTFEQQIRPIVVGHHPVNYCLLYSKLSNVSIGYTQKQFNRLREIMLIQPIIGYLISCSSPANKSEWKNSSIVIPRPSHNFLIVDTVALLFLPLTMLFTVDCVTPLMLLNLLMEISRS